MFVLRRLKLKLPEREVWDPNNEQFDFIGGQQIELEHSLYTIAGWEAKWHIPFANLDGIDQQQFLDYITTFMCQTPDIPKTAWLTIDEMFLRKVQAYMEDPCTATSIKGMKSKPRQKKKITTAEELYCYMFQLGIPIECERWHLNRLMTLIDVCAIRTGPQKKMGRKEAAQLQRQQNEMMRAKLGSRG